MGEVFKINRNLPYNLRTHNDFCSRVCKTVKYGTETIVFSSKTLGFSPRKDKRMFLFGNLKSKIKKWKPDCPCPLRKTYLQHVGFL